VFPLRYLVPILITLLCGGTAAQSYPDRPIKLIVPFAAGGPADIPPRLIAQRLSSKLGQPIYIENRTGGGGTVGAAAAARAKPDGYTLFCGSTGPLAIAPTLYAGSLEYDPQQSFAPIALLSQVPYLVLVGPATPANRLSDLVAYARENPGKVAIGAAAGAPAQLLGYLFRRLTATDVVIVPYRGGAPVLSDLLAGQLHAAFEATSIVNAHLGENGLRAIAAATPQRLSMLPSIPTTAEDGLGELTAYSWSGILAPRGTAPPVVASLNAAINDVLATADVQADLARLGSATKIGSADDFAGYIDQEIRKWAQLVRDSGMQAQ